MAPLLEAPENFEQRLNQALQHYQDAADKKLWQIGLDRFNASIEEFRSEPIPSVTIRFTVIREMCNPFMTLHGGCIQTLIFDFTTVLLIALCKFGLYSRWGASQNFTTRFFRQIGVGEEGILVCELDYVGRRRIVLRGKLYSEKGGELCAVAEHEKINTDKPVNSKM